MLSLSNASSSLGHSVISGQEHITDDAGNIYMYINIMGHVASPGTYLIYEDADILTILSQAGGPLPGAKLDKITIYNKDNGKINLDLELYLESGNMLDITIRPNDTIFIKQSIGSYLFSKSNLINSILQVLNIYLTIRE
tara:strand:+ start:66 stop:482 length:417 start_codon:yes stop_codon:yes gene_type:complete